MSRDPGSVERCRLVVSGRVQGVGFRWFTREAAAATGVLGWVQNRPDGTVLCEAQGEPTALAVFVAALQRGPSHARVDDVAQRALAPDPAVDGFEIR
ncbi:MAG: acylphosphatase [Planctomycetota bacterium]